MLDITSVHACTLCMHVERKHIRIEAVVCICEVGSAAVVHRVHISVEKEIHEAVKLKQLDFIW